MTVYLDQVSITECFNRLVEAFPREQYAIAVYLTNSGERYFVAEILHEWENAIEFLPEGANKQPMLAFKAVIETLRVMTRPHKTVRPDE